MANPQDSASFVALVQATAGAVGGVFASFLLQPVEVTKTRIQICQSGSASILGMMSQILADDGVPGLWRGAFAKCFETGSKNFVYFYIYDAINALALEKRRLKATVAVKLALGYVAGVGCTILTMPLEVLATRVQAEKGADGSLPVLLKRILEEDGITGLFTGFWYNIFLCINPAIQNMCFDKIKDAVLARKAAKLAGGRAALSPLEGFVLGAVAKAIATFVTFPLVRLKTILQAGKEVLKVREEPAKPGDEKLEVLHHREVSTSDLLNAMSFRTELQKSLQGPLLRIASLYRGLQSALFKSVLQAAILYMTKDQVAESVRLLFKLTSKSFLRRSGHLKISAISGRPLAS